VTGSGVAEPGAIDLGSSVVTDLLDRAVLPSAGTEVTCAVSGGADSLTLLVLAAAAGCSVTAVHVDHGLRAGSADEAHVVAAVAERVGARFRAERVVVEPGPNLEARARQARYAVLPDGVLTGHTADDRAETMVLHLLRGAGPTGMVGIRRSAQRPLLDLRRQQTVALCRELSLVPVDDPSNRDPRFRRNRVRHQVLPLLGDIGESDPVPVLVRQADLFAELDAFVADTAAGLDPTSAADLASAPAAVAGAAVRAWLAAAGVGHGYPAEAAAVERVLAVARRERVATEVLGGWRVARSHGRLSLTPPTPCKDAAHG